MGCVADLGGDYVGHVIDLLEKSGRAVHFENVLAPLAAIEPAASAGAPKRAT